MILKVSNHLLLALCRSHCRSAQSLLHLYSDLTMSDKHEPLGRSSFSLVSSTTITPRSWWSTPSPAPDATTAAATTTARPRKLSFPRAGSTLSELSSSALSPAPSNADSPYDSSFEEVEDTGPLDPWTTMSVEEAGSLQPNPELKNKVFIMLSEGWFTSEQLAPIQAYLTVGNAALLADVRNVALASSSNAEPV